MPRTFIEIRLNRSHLSYTRFFIFCRNQQQNNTSQSLFPSKATETNKIRNVVGIPNIFPRSTDPSILSVGCLLRHFKTKRELKAKQARPPHSRIKWSLYRQIPRSHYSNRRCNAIKIRSHHKLSSIWSIFCLEKSNQIHFHKR